MVEDTAVAADIHDICDLIIRSSIEAGEAPSVLKVQKLLYYCQAWSLAYTGAPLFAGEFQAWVHGPVNRSIYDRFSGKTMYSALNVDDIRIGFDGHVIAPDAINFVAGVLSVYAPYSDTQLAELTHREKPWIEARGALSPQARCETIISTAAMRETYGGRIGR